MEFGTTRQQAQNGVLAWPKPVSRRPTEGAGVGDAAQRPHAAVDDLLGRRGRCAAGTGDGEGQGSWGNENRAKKILLTVF